MDLSLNSVEPHIRVEVQRGIAVVRMDRPPVNSFNREMYSQMRRTFRRLSDREDLRVVVFTGNGKVFCAGNDVNDFVDLDFDEATEYLANVRISFHQLFECPVPVIAAINGSAVGTGIALTSLCDIRIASEKAEFALPEIDVGVLGGSKHVMRIAPQGLTRRMMYTGVRVTAAEALAVSMIDEVLPEDKVLGRAMEIANTIAEKNPAAIRLAKHGINRVENMSLNDGYEYECTLSAQVRRTPEAKEGALAFLEKRRPSYADER